MVAISYIKPTIRRRLERPEHELLYKTVRKAKAKTVVDATGGLGVDAMIFAAMGMQVQVIEASPILAGAMHTALIEALRENLSCAGNINLYCADSTQKLPSMQADICYLDPLFEVPCKGLPKQKAQDFIKHGARTGVAELFNAAKLGDFGRIIIKMPGNQEPIQTPTYQIKARAHRFDVFQIS